MTISLRLNEKDASLIKKYAEINNITVSELIRQSVIEKNRRWIWFELL